MGNNIMNIDTVNISEDKKSLVIIDQTQLPNNVEILYLKDQREIWEAIYLLKVRGAPAIGVAAAIGVYLASLEIETDNYDEFAAKFKEAKDYLASSRPTAVNLFWALDRMEDVVKNNKDKTVDQIKDLLLEEAIDIREEDIWVCKSIGEYGLSLIKDG
ncbi:MAG: S-methyl-5-thioribose-1-phosphate isomerase, partial [Christensenellaceae bacterium]|nr:S-methyl-5-thioribose-1-phosphate isomerase [Christensenellaceae bacterium]